MFGAGEFLNVHCLEVLRQAIESQVHNFGLARLGDSVVLHGGFAGEWVIGSEHGLLGDLCFASRQVHGSCCICGLVVVFLGRAVVLREISKLGLKKVLLLVLVVVASIISLDRLKTSYASFEFVVNLSALGLRHSCVFGVVVNISWFLVRGQEGIVVRLLKHGRLQLVLASVERVDFARALVHWLLHASVCLPVRHSSELNALLLAVVFGLFPIKIPTSED